MLRYAPGGGEGCWSRSTPRSPATTGNLGGAATAAGSNADAVRDLAELLRDAGEDVVIVYGERALTAHARRARC